MKLIVGLGNPGLFYARSRHNIGNSAVKALGKSCKAAFKRDSGTFALSAKTKIDSKTALLALPLTFMNLSGVSVRDLVKKYKIDLADLLIILDDLDLDFGRIKIKPGGSSAGHRGLNSIIEALGTDEFARLRIGIGRPHRNLEPSEFVLSPFKRKEKEALGEVLEESCACVRAWAQGGVTQAMNIFNKRS